MYKYFNCSIVNRETIDNNNDPELAYSETRNEVILENANDYLFSIVRFQLNGVSNLPLFIPRVEIGQNDINKTIYKISIRHEIYRAGAFHSTVYKSLPVTFRSQRTDVNRPNVPLTEQDFSTEYYSVYTYSHWLKLVNETFEQLHADLFQSVKNSLNDQTIVDVWKSPIMTKDSDSGGLFNLFLPKKNYGGSYVEFKNTGIELKSQLFFNSNMYGLFSNFHSQKQGNDLKNDIYPSENLKDANYEIVPIDYRNLDSTDDVKDRDGDAYWKMKQDFQSTDTLWNPIDSLVFTTSLIPINPEINGNPIIFTDGKFQQQANQNITELVITDLQAGVGSADGYSGLLTYVPSGEYRLSDFTSQKNYDLRNMSVRANYRNRLDGKLYPLKLFNGGSASVKMMFQKKY